MNVKKDVKFFCRKFPDDYWPLGLGNKLDRFRGKSGDEKLLCIWCERVILLENATNHLIDLDHMKCKKEGIFKC